MFKVQIFLNGKECQTKQLWDTREQAEEMKRLYQVFFQSKGTKNFTLGIVELD